MGEQEAAGTAGSQGATEFIGEMDVKSLAEAPARGTGTRSPIWETLLQSTCQDLVIK